MLDKGAFPAYDIVMAAKIHQFPRPLEKMLDKAIMKTARERASRIAFHKAVSPYARAADLMGKCIGMDIQRALSAHTLDPERVMSLTGTD